MLQIPVLRWGQPYTSMDVSEVTHFATGEPVARVSRANGGLVQRDIRHAQRARDLLRGLSIPDLVSIANRAGELYMTATLPLGDGDQSPDDFVRAQSATTGIPEVVCRATMQKNASVLAQMGGILTALTRGLDFGVLTAGHGEEHGVPISYQAQAPVLGLVLPSNTAGVHTLWLPALPLQVGLLMKPGSQEIWTPYRLAEAFFQAGLPRETIGLYPGGADVGGAVVGACHRSLVFGGASTVAQYRSNPGVQVHGPGFSKILLGDDVVDQWEQYLDVMVDSVLSGGGRGCINASGIWASRHTHEIAEALARRLSGVQPLAHDDPAALLAAFTTEGAAARVSALIDAALGSPEVTDVSAVFRDGPRLVRRGAADYLVPTVLRCASPASPMANAEFLFPFVSVVECPQAQMVSTMGPTLVCTAITAQPVFRRQLTDAVQIDRLNLGPVRTTQLNWLQPHEGNLIDFLFRSRAYQEAPL